MRLSELIKKINEVAKEKDPEIRIVSDGGFLNIAEVLHENSYYNESYSGKKFEKGNFVCLEIKYK